jgi:subtilisin family serine protease
MPEPSSESPDAIPKGPSNHYVPLDPEQQRERLKIQVEIILDNVPDAAVYPAGRPEDMEYLYIEGRILVRDTDLARVQAVVPGHVVDPLVNGLSVYAPRDHGTVAALEIIDAALGVGVATPDHIFYVTVATCCPATEPDPVSQPAPNPPPPPPPPSPAPGQQAAPLAGQGSLVTVIDTGLIRELENAQHPWLAGVAGAPELDYDPENIGPYVGHGTFVAGVLRCRAPGAGVYVEDLLNRAGAVSESGILRGLYRAVRRAPDVISMSAGCTTRHDLAPLSFEVFWEQRLSCLKGTVLVAAAGNNEGRRPFWPAAFRWTISVGALNRDHTRAGFSDYGSWVDVYALGQDIINAYPDGTYHYREPPRAGQSAQFTNEMAMWSGTSFSTPIVSGAIADQMSRAGQTGQLAADAVLSAARAAFLPHVGAVVT